MPRTMTVGTAVASLGMRALPNVQTGDWCCFYAEIQGQL